MKKYLSATAQKASLFNTLTTIIFVFGKCVEIYVVLVLSLTLTIAD
jgi:hypothetical protein